jgi:hypothetical protein
MKVYCLYITQTSDLEVFPPRVPIISEDRQKVVDALKDFVENEKRECDYLVNGTDWTIESDTETRFTAYEEGRYLENHVEAVVLEKELGELDWSC